MKPYPLLCKPVLKSKIWGGNRLAHWVDGEIAPSDKIGEAWMAADLKEGASTIANGPLSGETLTRAVELWGESLIGPAWGDSSQFPLLVKIIDAQDDLSVQVHPSNEDCAAHFPDDAGKDESWIILESENGTVLKGFEPGVTKEDYKRALGDGSFERITRTIAVSPGDSLRIAPGTIHAMCKGVLVLEIQQPSDSTFRIYDYGRVGDDGQPRETHLEQSLEVMNYEYEDAPLLAPQTLPDGTEGRSGAKIEVVVDVPAYRIERASIDSDLSWNVGPDSAQILFLASGEATLHHGETTLDLVKGSTVVLPAGSGDVRLASTAPIQAVAAHVGGRGPVFA